MQRSSPFPTNSIEDAALAWLERVGARAWILLSVPEGLWVALLMLTPPLFLLRLFFDKGQRVKATRDRVSKAFWDVVKTGAGLYFFTLAGNAAPILGWLVAGSWTAALVWTLKLAISAISNPGSDGLDWMGQMLEEVRRRMLLSARVERNLIAGGTVPSPTANPDPGSGQPPLASEGSAGETAPAAPIDSGSYPLTPDPPSDAAQPEG